MECITQEFDEICKQRNHLQDRYVTSSKGVRLHDMCRNLIVFWSKRIRLFVLKKNIWFLSGIAVVFATVMIAWLIESGQVISAPIIVAEKNIAAQTTPNLPAIGEAAQVLEALPSPAAGQILRETHDANRPRRTSTGETTRSQDTTSIASVVTLPSLVPKAYRVVSEKTAPPTQSTDTVEGRKSSIHEPSRTAASVDKEGAWVINLASLSSKVDADRLVKKTQSKDIETEQQQVTVKGKQYWRVQITGFSTAAEARENSVAVKEKLGLKDVWITTR